jgi:hypothetical protein
MRPIHEAITNIEVGCSILQAHIADALRMQNELSKPPEGFSVEYKALIQYLREIRQLADALQNKVLMIS